MRISITTRPDKQARVTIGSDVHVVEPGTHVTFDATSVTVIEQAVPGASPRSGGGGHGDPDQK